MNNDIIAIQEILSHQGDEILRMSKELYVQQSEINKLRDQVKKLFARLNTGGEDDTGIRPLDQESPPPHY